MARGEVLGLQGDTWSGSRITADALDRHVFVRARNMCSPLSHGVGHDADRGEVFLLWVAVHDSFAAPPWIVLVNGALPVSERRVVVARLLRVFLRVKVSLRRYPM